MRLLQPAFVRDIAASPSAITSRRRAAAGGSHEWADAGLAALCVADQRPATRFHPQRAVIGRSVEGPTVGTDWSHVAAPQSRWETRAPPLERMFHGAQGGEAASFRARPVIITTEPAMDIVELPLEHLIPYARNPRKNAAAVAVAASSRSSAGASRSWSRRRW